MSKYFRGENENRIVRIREDKIHSKLLIFSMDYEVPYQQVFDAFCNAVAHHYTINEITDQILFDMLVDEWLPF